MNNRRTIACIIGTRPEAIKMVPVVRALQDAVWARCVVIATAQHRGLLDQMLGRFRIAVDHDLDLMQEGQLPNDLMARMLPALQCVLQRERAEVVLAQGDTTTVLASALTAFHSRLPFGHVEAGLRTHDLDRPFPEEGYRQMVSRIARWHFAPTERAASSLRAEGIPDERIHVTGNTCIDALLQTVAELGPPSTQAGRMVLLTAHRRESFGEPLRRVFTAVKRIVERFPDVHVVYPVHPNPAVQSAAREILADHPRIRLVAPLDYFDFVDLMRRATLILTDSGGIQEEAPALGKPVLVLREVTERPEAVDAGVSEIVGTDSDGIVAAAVRLLSTDECGTRIASKASPFGDGHAAQRIVGTLARSISDQRMTQGVDT